ncbi:hypothetical protein CDD82_3143 [Ophiocordyceps australis]|uniref:Amine oxidase domain-containing protein n=1 Tax=Ophiocordyceps australis TaxID=1399860 RepID=A0A2C5ZB83_9HYPO|nr:hypothetical protein CDD82_3143 [Ophiocordyceps australis]
MGLRGGTKAGQLARGARLYGARLYGARLYGARLYGTRLYGAASGQSNEGEHVAIVGGGLTGLTTAYYLAKRLPRTTRLTVYEASDRLGGWLQTERVAAEAMGLGMDGGSIAFERGPRTLTSLRETTWRLDDLVLWDVADDDDNAPPRPTTSASKSSLPRTSRATSATATSCLSCPARMAAFGPCCIRSSSA